MAWCNASRCAEHLGLRKARFLMLVRQGRFPPPSYHAGERSPRWCLEELDSAMKGPAGTDHAQEVVSAALRKMEEEGRARRAAKEARQGRS
jgi:hypothetical protein